MHFVVDCSSLCNWTVVFQLPVLRTLSARLEQLRPFLDRLDAHLKAHRHFLPVRGCDPKQFYDRKVSFVVLMLVVSVFVRLLV